MTRLHTDFLGPFVECNGSVNRPAEPSALLGANKLKATHIRYTPTSRVKDDAGNEEIWYECGSVAAYKEAHDTMSKEAFEKFAAMSCGTLAIFPALPYPQVRKLYPKGYCDYRSKSFRDYMTLTKSLENAVHDRRRAEIATKEAIGAPKTTPAGASAPKTTFTTAASVPLQVLRPPISPVSPPPAKKRRP